MKTLLITITAITAFFINAASAGSGSIELGYGSDLFRNGSLIAQENTSAAINYQSKLSGLDVSASAQGAFDNENGDNIYILSAGASKQLSDLFTVYAGLEHEEALLGVSQLDAVIKIDLESILNPSLRIQRNLDESDYVFEGSISQSFDVRLADLNVGASYGSADRYGVSDNEYWLLSADFSKEISESVSASVSCARVDSDISGGENVISAGISLSF